MTHCRRTTTRRGTSAKRPVYRRRRWETSWRPWARAARGSRARTLTRARSRQMLPSRRPSMRPGRWTSTGGGRGKQKRGRRPRPRPAPPRPPRRPKRKMKRKRRESCASPWLYLSQLSLVFGVFVRRYSSHVGTTRLYILQLHGGFLGAGNPFRQSSSFSKAHQQKVKEKGQEGGGGGGLSRRQNASANIHHQSHTTSPPRGVQRLLMSGGGAKEKGELVQQLSRRLAPRRPRSCGALLGLDPMQTVPRAFGQLDALFFTASNTLGPWRRRFLAASSQAYPEHNMNIHRRYCALLSRDFRIHRWVGFFSPDYHIISIHTLIAGGERGLAAANASSSAQNI
mmetsp:Transcript_15443/g.46641  ORF Transcript_15443/g.46641 Transcript_15443/m.46641 type:complete len:340 (-) Transcript_15443:1228-2247(-)